MITQAVLAATLVLTPVPDWVRRTAVPLVTIDPAAPLDDLAPMTRMVGGAKVVGLGESTHGAHEEALLKHRVLRHLVEKMGFRTIAWEEDWTTGQIVDRYITEGKGDLDAVVRQLTTTWQAEEVRDVLRWLRGYNATHKDKVRFVGVEFYATRPAAYDAVARYVAKAAPAKLDEVKAHLDAIRPPSDEIGPYFRELFESGRDMKPYIAHARAAYNAVKSLPETRAQQLALHNARQIVSFHEYIHRKGDTGYRDQQSSRNLRWWQRHSGDKVAYWAASAHTANAPDLRVSLPPMPELRFATAGSHLRRWYGRQYLSMGFTFDHGTLKAGKVPRPPRDWYDRPLGDAGLRQYVLDLRVGTPSQLYRPARMRGIGGYDPKRPFDYYMYGGTLPQWFDVIVHRQTITPLRVLG
ncbi:erythromycin esterase family protein [Nonomuraea typhae]|uniref:erythromycin esterase family protein n=1 Tax=Nonomuraea typhae TaxID=2603600 RepID=UPI0012FB0D2F|nr:erythromycin esterase family protein [Nonomuraea typhae]